MSKGHIGSEGGCSILDLLFWEKGIGYTQVFILHVLYEYDFFTKYDGETDK